MAWSTSELAELAGTTLKTVRHYHRIGLLAEPERSSNGYKQYGVRHLVRLLRIRRLVALGVPLSDVASVEAADEGAEQTLRALDAELAASIERQREMRRELAAVLENRALLDLPTDAGTATDELSPDLLNAVEDLSETQRSLLLTYSSILTPSAMSMLQEQLAAPLSEVGAQFESLPADAPDDVRRRLAERLAPEIRTQQEDHPALRDLHASSRRGRAITQSVVVQSLTEFYNAAQLDVLRLVHDLLSRQDNTGGQGEEPGGPHGPAGGLD
ncbi:Mercuric resistance operon regulatory protein [Streptomyces sp. YIM 130001]|uniref:helix-turn-helix domain-containing protein n=1 Tax=Streptomyces sp. YIM 130001 TaxID=2259644 RepID=UPI000E64C05D|nr:MerR family transcriptional regulator [Streptomyces sp. YIM 130001]RII22183.1 Mercuric resistance operon regulatory protein [Streptomyces sp. YIM 130001]